MKVPVKSERNLLILLGIIFLATILVIWRDLFLQSTRNEALRKHTKAVYDRAYTEGYNIGYEVGYDEALGISAKNVLTTGFKYGIVAPEIENEEASTE